MNAGIKTLLVLIIAFFLIASPATAANSIDSGDDSEPTYAGMAVDLAVIRPLGFTATALGCLIFTAALPFTVWSKDRITKAGHNFVATPGNFTFVRPLGEMIY